MFGFKKRDFDKEVPTELPVLYRIARRLTRSEVEAEDLVAQTLLKAHKAWNQFDGVYLRSWLIKILRNEHRNRLRYEASRPETIGIEEDTMQPESVWEEVNWRIAGERILQELDLLPEDFRLAIQLCDVEQMSYEEAAAAMEVPVGTVRSRIFRGRRQLRDRLSDLVTMEAV